MKRRLIYLLLSLGVLATPVFSWWSSVHAANAAEWRAGNIIEDTLFSNAGGMSVDQIQTFLNEKIPVCDTWGQKNVGYYYNSNSGKVRFSWFDGGAWVTTSRAVYADRYNAYYGTNDAARPFKCLKDYYEVPKVAPGLGLPASNFASMDIPPGARSAAQLISDAAYAYNISPQVLLVKLGTESAGPLTTDDWPFRNQYLYAMGAHCPDSGPGGSANCDANYAGFSIQMMEAAKLLRGYINNMQQTWWPHKRPYQDNFILWNVAETGCGGGNVYIENKATAALYTYTPYQPNRAALDNLYSTGDGCSAYGNRNFWRVYSDWFGSPRGSVSVISSLDVSSDIFSPGLFVGQTTRARFVIKNNTPQTINLGWMAIAVRDQNGNNHDFGSQQVILQPWQTYYYNQVKTLSSEGKYTFWITNYRDGYGWDDNYPQSSDAHTRRVQDVLAITPPTVIAGPSIDEPNLHVGQTTKVRFTVKNNSRVYPANLGYFGLAMTSPSQKNVDPAFDTQYTLLPEAMHEYVKEFTPQEAGTYTSRISATGDWATWSESRYPLPMPGATNRLSISVKGSPTITQGLTLSNPAPIAGDIVTGSFKVKNFGTKALAVNKNLCYILRNNKNENYDLGCLWLGTLEAGEEKTFTAARQVKSTADYTGFFSMYDGTWHDNWTFSREKGDEPVTIQFKTKPNPVLTQGLNIDRTLPVAGDFVGGSFKVKNTASAPIDINKNLCYILRNSHGENYDLGCLALGNLQPGEERVFTGKRQLMTAGTYKAYFSMYDGFWHDNWAFDPATGTEPKTLQFVVKSNPVLTQGLTLVNSSVVGGEVAKGTFMVKNTANATVTVNKSLCWIMRNVSNTSNYDLGCKSIGDLAAGEEAIFQGEKVLPSGTYKAYFSMYDGFWHDNWAFDPATGTEPKTLQFVVKSNPVLTQGLTITNTSPKVGDTLNGTFKVKNTGSVAVTVNKSLCWIMRDSQNRNADMSCLDIGVLQPGQELTYTGARVALVPGTYKAYFSMYDGYWHDGWTFDQATGIESKTLQFTVAP